MRDKHGGGTCGNGKLKKYVENIWIIDRFMI